MPGFKAKSIELLEMDSDNDSVYLFTVARAPWFIATVFCAVALVWVPLFARLRSGINHGSLDIIATLTTAAAIRGFLTSGSDDFTPIALDFFLFFPLILLGILSLRNTGHNVKTIGCHKHEDEA